MREKKKNSGVILWVKSWRMYFTFCDINKLFSRLWNYYDKDMKLITDHCSTPD